MSPPRIEPLAPVSAPPPLTLLQRDEDAPGRAALLEQPGQLGQELQEKAAQRGLAWGPTPR